MALMSAWIVGELAREWFSGGRGNAIPVDMLDDFTRRRDAELMPYYKASVQRVARASARPGQPSGASRGEPRAMGGGRDESVRADARRRAPRLVVPIRAPDGGGVARRIIRHSSGRPRTRPHPRAARAARAGQVCVADHGAARTVHDAAASRAGARLSRVDRMGSVRARSARCVRQRLDAADRETSLQRSWPRWPAKRSRESAATRSCSVTASADWSRSSSASIVE